MMALLVATAWGQDLRSVRCLPTQTGIAVVDGTVGQATLEAATTRSNQTWGAASLAQDRIAHIAEGVRRMEDDGDDDEDGARVALLSESSRRGLYFSGISIHTTATYGAIRLPVCTEEGIRSAPVDLVTGGMSYSFALHRNVHVFYAAGVGLRILGYDEPAFRGGLAAAPIGLAVYAPVAILKPRFETNTGLTIDFDYILGVDLVSGRTGSIAIGYAGSSGVFSNLTENHVKLFAGIVVDELASEIANPFLAAGFSSLDWVVGDAAVKIVGHTKLFGRRQLQVAPAPDTVVADLSAPPPTSRFSTLNLEQTGIGGHFDIIVRATIEPTPELYEATLGYQASKLGGQLDFFVRGGVVKLPDLWFYGRDGGMRPRFETGIGLGDTLPGMHALELGLGVNDAEVLSVFPYAYNAVQFRFRVGV